MQTEFRPIQNSEIRRRAWELCKKHYGKMLSATLIVSLITTLTTMIDAGLGSLGTAAALLIGVFFSPVVEVGMIFFVRKLWHGENAKISGLFHHFYYWARIWGIMLLCGLPNFMLNLASFLFTLVTTLLLSFLKSDFYVFSALIPLVAMIPCFILSIWLSIRLSLAFTAFVFNPETSAMDCVRTSWRASRGNVGRLFCNGLAVCLPLIAAVVLIEFLTPGSLWLDGLLTLLFSTLFTGYAALGEYGLAEYLLTGKIDLGKENCHN